MDVNAEAAKFAYHLADYKVVVISGVLNTCHSIGTCLLRQLWKQPLLFPLTVGDSESVTFHGCDCASTEGIHVAGRMFEAMAAGAAVVTESRLVPHLASLGLVDGWHYISCAESLEGLWNGLGFLLGNNDSRVDADVAALAARGQALVKQRFSTLHEQRAVWAAISAPASGCSLTQPTTPALAQGAGL